MLSWSRHNRATIASPRFARAHGAGLRFNPRDQSSRVRTSRSGSTRQARNTAWAMSEGNLEVVRTLFRAFDRADYEAALEELDPEIEWHAPPGITIGQEVYRGRDEVSSGFAEWLAAWDIHRFELEEMLDHGDHVVVGGMQIGRGRGSGVEVRVPTFHVLRV